jgi:hypothetical protein
MTDPIIPGIDDERAREILRGLAAGSDWRITPVEGLTLMLNGIASPQGSRPTMTISDAGRALWERIKNND